MILSQLDFSLLQAASPGHDASGPMAGTAQTQQQVAQPCKNCLIYAMIVLQYLHCPMSGSGLLPSPLPGIVFNVLKQTQPGNRENARLGWQRWSAYVVCEACCLTDGMSILASVHLCMCCLCLHAEDYVLGSQVKPTRTLVNCCLTDSIHSAAFSCLLPDFDHHALPAVLSIQIAHLSLQGVEGTHMVTRASVEGTAALKAYVASCPLFKVCCLLTAHVDWHHVACSHCTACTTFHQQ